MKHSYLIILLCLSTLTLTASPVTPEEGLTAATHFMKSQLGTAPIAMQLVQTGQSRSRGVLTDCYYIYNVENGFVIVSADTRVRPILGYSTEGVFSPADVPFGMQELLDSYTDEIEAIVANVAEPDAQYNFSNSHGAVTHIRPRQNDIGENSIATAAHPNPATSIVTMEAGNHILKVTVYDLAGRVVMAVDGGNERSASVKVTSLPDGIYLLSIVTVGGVETVRLVKQ